MVEMFDLSGRKLMSLKWESEDPSSDDLSVPPQLWEWQRQESEKSDEIDDDDTGWSNLPSELLLLILQKLEDPTDIFNSASVCASWNSALKTSFPYFLLFSNVGIYRGKPTSPNKTSCTLYNPKTNTLHQILLPILKGKWFSSSSFGWLLTIRIRSPHQLALLNPFTRHQIRLPPAKFFYKNSRPEERPINPKETRVITSTSPLNPNCLFLASHSSAHSGANKLSICRLGDKSWTNLDFESFCDDIIYYKGDFYAIDVDGYLYHIHCNIGATKKLPVPPVELVYNYQYYYLVELNGDLLLVVRCGKVMVHIMTCKFYVYKLNWRKNEWMKMESIGRNVILLGIHSSMSLPAGHRDLRANCIYFIDEGNKHHIDAYYSCNSGLYDLTTEIFEYIYHIAPIWKTPITPLNWFIPTLQVKCKAEDKSWLSKIWTSICKQR